MTPVREDAARKRVAVVLFQLGGPDSLAAVRPFLYNLFCDPDIIPLGLLGAIVRKPLAWWISRRRSRIVAEHYKEIGGRSPILPLTEQQARKLEGALRERMDARVFIAMRYWHPLTEEALRQAHAFAPKELVLLPLYPQYSLATTLSSLKEWRRVYGAPAGGPRVHEIEEFHDHPLYIGALVEKINLGLARFGDSRRVHFVFSAHGLPVSLIEKGDPYQRQMENTVRLVLERGRWTNAYTLCYQSKVGRQKWLEPSLTETIERLAREGEKHLLVIPVAFVTEHIETLHEINIEAREIAEKLGVQKFEVMEAMNDSPQFIAALTDLVFRELQSKPAATSPTAQ